METFPRKTYWLVCVSTFPHVYMYYARNYSHYLLGSLTIPLSIHLFNMTIPAVFCSHIICQKCASVCWRGPWGNEPDYITIMRLINALRKGLHIKPQVHHHPLHASTPSTAF